MSKAFTKESEQDDEDGDAAVPALPGGTKNYITPAGF
ncbi:MAG TPA: transcription elongation factor GreB, partial [Burkholderiales bacterium]|nr:transcription elongation factor GreB [Burkholderiales bacterium]